MKGQGLAGRILRYPVKIDPTWQVGASGDDCYRSTVTVDYFLLNDIRVLVGYYNASYQNFGSAMRFLNITIPAGSVILVAHLVITSLTNDSSATVNSRIRCQKDINPLIFSTGADLDARPWTTAYVNWDSIPAWSIDTEYTSPDLKACVQEVIDLPGWASGNPMVVEWDDWQKRSTQSANTRRDGYSYDGSPIKAPKLHIEFTPPGKARIPNQNYLVAIGAI